MKILLNAYDTTVKRLAGHPNLGQLATPSNRPSGLPAAFVAQDGLRFDDVPWRYIACLFVGGSTEFKLGPIAREAIGIAQSGGLLVHVGRVNSYRRLRRFRELDVDSVDGSGFTRFRKRYLPRALRVAATHERQRDLFEGGRCED